MCVRHRSALLRAGVRKMWSRGAVRNAPPRGVQPQLTAGYSAVALLSPDSAVTEPAAISGLRVENDCDVVAPASTEMSSLAPNGVVTSTVAWSSPVLVTRVTSTVLPTTQRVAALISMPASASDTVTVASMGWRESSCAIPATVKTPGSAYADSGTSSQITSASETSPEAVVRRAVSGSAGALPASVATSMSSTDTTAMSGA